MSVSSDFGSHPFVAHVPLKLFSLLRLCPSDLTISFLLLSLKDHFQQTHFFPLPHLCNFIHLRRLSFQFLFCFALISIIFSTQRILIQLCEEVNKRRYRNAHLFHYLTRNYPETTFIALHINYYVLWLCMYVRISIYSDYTARKWTTKYASVWQFERWTTQRQPLKQNKYRVVIKIVRGHWTNPYSNDSDRKCKRNPNE